MPGGSRVVSSQLTAATDWTRADFALALSSLAGLAAVGALLVRDVASERDARPEAGPAAGRVEWLLGDVLRRPDGTLAWHETGAGDELHAYDSLYVPPGAYATVHLADGSRLDLAERTLVVIEPPAPAGQALRLVKGSLTGFAAGTVAVRGGETVALLEPGSAALLDAGEDAAPRVEVLAGRAIVGNAAVGPAPGAVRLDAPARHERLYAASFPAPVTLRWDPGDPSLRVEVAGSPGALPPPTLLSPAGAGEASFEVPAPGAYTWRLVDAAGAPRSETRRFFALEDAPPRPVTPAAGEIVLAPGGAQIPFFWTAAQGARRYRLEIAPDPAFAAVGFGTESETPGAWITPGMPEGVYHWRVRVSQPGREGSPWSVSTPFRLIRRPLPEAPRLFDASIEVERGTAR
jgi:hypothetical protein